MGFRTLLPTTLSQDSFQKERLALFATPLLLNLLFLFENPQHMNMSKKKELIDQGLTEGASRAKKTGFP